MDKKLPIIYNIRRTLEDCVREKLKANVTDAGTWLDFKGADLAFESKGRRYSVDINDITEDEEKPKETPQKDWAKGYNKWRKTQ